jgi:hypothetical protein
LDVSVAKHHEDMDDKPASVVEDHEQMDGNPASDIDIQGEQAVKKH